MTWQEAFDDAGLTIASRWQLMAAGATGRGLTSAVKAGFLVRARRDHYALPDTDQRVLRAARVGGRLCCVSALNLSGVFAFDATFAHIHMLKHASRSRSPRNARVPLSEINREGAQLHWWPLHGDGGNEFRVGIPDALAQAIRCQQPWHSIASLDSAVHLAKIDDADVAEIFRHVPERFQLLRAQVDGRSEAGQESVLRLIMQAAGLHCDIQAEVPGVGRVDMIVEGILALEADSRQFHDGWAMHVQDRDRDLGLARHGYMSLRPVYQRTMFRPNEVRDAALNLLAAWNHHRVFIV